MTVNTPNRTVNSPISVICSPPHSYVHNICKLPILNFIIYGSLGISYMYIIYITPTYSYMLGFQLVTVCLITLY